MTNYSNKVASDLTKESLLELRASLNDQQLAFKPANMVVSQEGIDRARQMAADDPDYKKMLLAEFPQLAALIE